MMALLALGAGLVIGGAVGLVAAGLFLAWLWKGQAGR